MSTIRSDQVGSGAALQFASTSYSAVATGTTQLPQDDTIPQITEGNEYMTQVITPKSATNLLVIQVKGIFSFSVAAALVAGALFQDATANALATTCNFADTATAPVELNITYAMFAGTTSATTFRVRAGVGAAGTVTFNGQSGARRYGAIPKSTITITEYKA